MKVSPSRARLVSMFKKKGLDNMNNLNLIANYLFDHPGAPMTAITRHLCDVNGKSWNRGYYTRYFSNYRMQTGIAYADRLWCKTPDDSGWMLMLEGYGYVTKFAVTVENTSSMS